MLYADILTLSQHHKRRMLRKASRVAPKNTIGEIYVDNTGWFSIFKLNASQKNIFRRGFSFTIHQLRSIWRTFDLDAFWHILLDHINQHVPIGREFDPVPRSHCVYHKGSAPLLGK